MSVLREVLGDLHPRSIVVVVLLLVVAALLSRFVNSVVHRTLERHRVSGTLLAESVTRLQITRRILDAIIWVMAISIGLAQFPELRVLSAGLLASAGLSGLIVGFAARSTLGNAVAGVTIAFSQPVRIGDEVELRGERGAVEDITLLFTIIRLWDGKRMIVPNETLSTEVVKNLTLGSVSRIVRTDVLVPPKGDARAAMEALLGVAGGGAGRALRGRRLGRAADAGAPVQGGAGGLRDPGVRLGGRLAARISRERAECSSKSDRCISRARV
jgi:small-conductance mechanosensitive channel